MKNAILFGASGLLGPIWANALADKFDTVICLGLNLQNDLRLNKVVASRPDSFVLIECDLSGPIEVFMESFVNELRFSAAVFNAAHDSIPGSGKEVLDLKNLDLESWQEYIDKNTRIFINCLDLVINRMSSETYAVVIGSMYTNNVPKDSNYSDNGIVRFRKHPGYAASKGAIKNIMRQYAASLAPEGLVLNMLSPGVVENSQPEWFISNIKKQIPCGRLIDPEELSEALKFLVSPGSKHMIGQEILLDGGYSLW